MSRTVPALSLFTLGLCIATGAPLAAYAARPTEHESEAGRYRARFPDKPASTTKNLATGKQVVRVVTERAAGPRELVYAVTYTDYPEAFASVPPGKLLDGVTGGLKGQDGQVVSQTDMEPMDGVRAGRSLRIDAGRNALRVNVYLVGSRLYQVMVTGPRDAIESPGASEFLASFELVK